MLLAAAVGSAEGTDEGAEGRGGAVSRRQAVNADAKSPIAQARAQKSLTGPSYPSFDARADFPAVAGGSALGDVSTMEPLGTGDPGSPLARQMAKLLAQSDLQELEEIVKRWIAEAPTERVRGQYQQFGAKLLELKRALASAPEQPSEEELELALNMMLKLAAQGAPGTGPPRS
jgi:hypothetical protein